MSRARAATLVNLTAEQAVIGCLLRSTQDYWAVQDNLRADMFSKPIHREIFTVVSDLAMTGKRVAVPVLLSRLPEEDGDGNTVAALISALVGNAEDLSIGDFAEEVAETASRRQLLALSESLAKAARNGDKTALEVASDAEASILDIMHVSSPRRPQLIGDVAKSLVQLGRRAKERDEVPGIETGILSIDEILGRILPGDFGAILASQGDGKSALAMQIAIHNASQNIPMLFFQMDMTAEQLAAREVAFRAGAKIGEIFDGSYTFDTRDRLPGVADDLGKMPLWIFDDPRPTMRHIRAQALAIKRRYGRLGGIILDHIRKIKAEGRSSNKFDRAEEITGDCKVLGKELDTPVIGLVQRTRGAQRRDDPMPQIDDAESPSLEQDVDWAMGVWRKESWLRRNRPKGGEALSTWEFELKRCASLAEVVVLKTRRGKAHETRQLGWDGPGTRVYDLGQQQQGFGY